MAYRVTQRGMLNGIWREGGSVISDEDATDLWNRDDLVFSGYLVATDEEPTRAIKAHAARAETPDEIEATPMPSEPETEPEAESIPPPSIPAESVPEPTSSPPAVAEAEPEPEPTPPKPVPRKSQRSRSR